MHIVLSLLVGFYMMATFQTIWSDRNLTTAIVYAPPEIPLILRLYMMAMGIIAFGNFLYDLYKWLQFRRENRVQNPNFQRLNFCFCKNMKKAAKIVVEAIIPVRCRNALGTLAGT